MVDCEGIYAELAGRYYADIVRRKFPLPPKLVSVSTPTSHKEEEVEPYEYDRNDLEDLEEEEWEK